MRIRIRPIAVLLSCLILPVIATAQNYGVVDISSKTLQVGSPSIGDNTPGAPITISVPGHYRLSADLVASGTVFQISASNGAVTLDLNGFSIKGGAAPCTLTISTIACPTATTQHGIVQTGGQGEQLQIRNGTVEAFTGNGISCSGCSIDSVTSRLNHGIGISGNQIRVRQSHAAWNGLGGMVIGEGTASSSSAKGNGRFGIAAGVVRDVHIDSTLSAGGENAYGLDLLHSGEQVTVTRTTGFGAEIHGHLNNAVVDRSSSIGVVVDGGTLTNATVRNNLGGVMVQSGLVRNSVMMNNQSFELSGNPAPNLNHCNGSSC